MNLQPLNDRIVVLPVEVKDVTDGGIHLVVSAKEKPSRGTVVAVGPGKRSEQGVRISMDVNVGDLVIYGKYAGTEVDGFILIRSDDVLAVVKDSEG